MRQIKHARTIILAVTALAVAVLIFLPAFSTVRVSTRQPRVLNDMKKVGYALMAYSMDHHGHIPVHLSELSSELDSPDALQYHDPDTGKTYDWLYYPGPKLTYPENTSAILLAAPDIRKSSDSNAYRLVVLADNSAELLLEKDFQAQLQTESQRPPSRH
jgi:hypothetical protein